MSRMSHWQSKLIKALVIGKMKENIVQLGGMPGQGGGLGHGQGAQGVRCRGEGAHQAQDLNMAMNFYYNFVICDKSDIIVCKAYL